VVVDSNVKKVQHANGGVVASINVREGDHVRAGQLVVRLDDRNAQLDLSQAQALLQQVEAQAQNARAANVRKPCVR
jgi:HlyD family secretion protein